MILVVGATGKVGREVVRQLAAAGAPLRALVRNPARASHIRLPGVDVAVGDLARPETLDAGALGSRSRLSSPRRRIRTRSSSRATSSRPASAAACGHDREGVGRGRSGRRHADRPLALDDGEADRGERPRVHDAAPEPLHAADPPLRAVDRGERRASRCRADRGRCRSSTPRDVAAVAVAALTQHGHDRQIYDLTGPEALSLRRRRRRHRPGHRSQGRLRPRAAGLRAQTDARRRRSAVAGRRHARPLRRRSARGTEAP